MVTWSGPSTLRLRNAGADLLERISAGSPKCWRLIDFDSGGFSRHVWGQWRVYQAPFNTSNVFFWGLRSELIRVWKMLSISTRLIIRFHRESLRDSNAKNDWRPYVALDIWRVQGPGTIKIHTRCGSWSGKPKDRPCWEEIDGIWSEDIPPLNCKEEYMCPAHGSFWQDLHVSV